jgi:hypothetical protein
MSQSENKEASEGVRNPANGLLMEFLYSSKFLNLKTVLTADCANCAPNFFL